MSLVLYMRKSSTLNSAKTPDKDDEHSGTLRRLLPLGPLRSLEKDGKRFNCR